MVKSWKDLTAEQYLELMESPSKNDILKIIYGKDINDIPIKYYNENQLDFLQKDPEKTEVLTYSVNGKTYKMVNLDNTSMGEYIDVSTYAEDWKNNIWKLMTVLYRPLKGPNLKHRLKVWVGNRLIKGGVILKSKNVVTLGNSLVQNMDYTIEKYDPEKQLLNQDDFKKMPADQFHSFILFFSLLLMKKMGDTLKSMAPNLPGKNLSPKKPKRNSVSKAGDGTTSSTS